MDLKTLHSGGQRNKMTAARFDFSVFLLHSMNDGLVVVKQNWKNGYSYSGVTFQSINMSMVESGSYGSFSYIVWLDTFSFIVCILTQILEVLKMLSSEKLDFMI